MTALAKAFQDAGYQTDSERLQKVAEDAVRQSGQNWDKARDALLRAVRGDAGLLWVMFEQYRAQAAQKVLTDASTRVHEEKRRGHESTENHGKHAPSSNSAGQRFTENQENCAGGIHPLNPKPRPNPQPQPEKPKRPTVEPRKPEAATIIAQVVRRSMLDDMKVNGVAIGDCTPNQAKSWARYAKRDLRFVELLTSNLPPDRPIREFINPDEADAIYKRAQKEAFSE